VHAGSCGSSRSGWGGRRHQPSGSFCHILGVSSTPRLRVRARTMGADRRAKARERRRTAQQNGVTRGDTCQDGHTETYTATVLWLHQGYYRHVERYIPDWPGMSDLSADVLHPQRWLHGYDRSAKQVLVIGSGTTAVTIIPALADTVALWRHSQDCRADKAIRCRQQVSSAGTGHRKVDQDNWSIHYWARL